MQANYNSSILVGPIGLPATVNESLATKPYAQTQFQAMDQMQGPIPTTQMKLDYVNFYANLLIQSDNNLVSKIVAWGS